MTSGSYTRRQCPACGTKGRLTSAEVYAGIPGRPGAEIDIEPAMLPGSRCGSCKAEIVRGLVVRQGREKPGPAEIQARRRVIRAEIRELEADIKSKQQSISELTLVYEALAKME
jgi:hypothetical protein